MIQVLVDKDPGLTGNLLVERLVGAHIELISKEEYANIGSVVCILLRLTLFYIFQVIFSYSNGIKIHNAKLLGDPMLKET